MTKIDVGEVAEKLVHNFFDQHFSNVYSFRDPKTLNNAQVADVLVWLNRIVFLVEVKARSEGSATIESWSRSRIEQATSQIVNNYGRFQAKEQINIHNTFYNFPFLHEGINHYIGIIILVTDESISTKPSLVFPDVYEQVLPIHVFTWSQLEQLTREIDTTMDFFYYLADRGRYLKVSDIPLDQEMNALGYYKSRANKFPNTDLELTKTDYWIEYQDRMKDDIAVRDNHNKLSGWVDQIESLFVGQRRLFDGIPLGMYYAWEFGAMSRRERAYLGEKLNTVQEWFDSGKSSRQFCWQNPSTGNWIVFYYSICDSVTIQNRLARLIRLKLIKENYLRGFDLGVYGLAIQVGAIHPRRILGVVGAVMMGMDDEIRNSVESEIEEALSVWGRDEGRKSISIEEFPNQ